MVFITFYIVFILWLHKFFIFVNIFHLNKMTDKTLLFQDEASDQEDNGKDVMNINENFKSKYEHNQRRDLIGQGKL